MIEDLQVFATAARCQSFSEAARVLKLPTSSVSRRISSLEAQLGTSLFVRTTRHLELTEAGRVYLDSVQRALAELADGHNAVAGLGGEVRGTLVVDARVALGAQLIVPVMPQLLALHPQLRVDLRMNHSLSPALEDGVDIGVRYEIGPDSELISRKFAVSRRVVAASPAYLKRRGTPMHPEELAHHECVAFIPDGNEPLWRFRGQGYSGAITPRGALQSNDGFGVRAAAVAGVGVILTHDWLVAAELKSGHLVRVLADYEASTLTSFETPLYLIYNKHLRDVAKVRAFVDVVVAQYRSSLIISR